MPDDEAGRGESKKLATEGWIELKLAAFRSEMRLLFVVAIAGNQVLSHLAVGVTGSIVANSAIVGLAVLKAVLF